MNLLFAIDDNVVTQLMTTLYSIKQNSSAKNYSIYVIQDRKLRESKKLQDFCQKLGMHYHPVMVQKSDFDSAPTTDRYPKTIYYRLLAHKYLPKNIKRILYLDVDILIINDLKPLYQIDLKDYWYAAASHNSLDVTDDLNKLRLGNYETESYYNSGVLLMDLDSIRENVKASDIFAYIKKKGKTLVLPDQDVLNGLYGQHIMKVPDELYNYDARMNPLYFAKSNGDWDIDWVIDHTVVLHFCGRDKPWLPDYKERFSGLYKHYAHKTKQIL
ncbi:glycosyltransferase family 8 protein [Companilactobacillus halodurans]|uniref:Glycosyltransferase family 8 protein n=1 Tax=Companilactobacillus halodurans TaxID=2584183 RepID=A0A5P0ZQY6_9LACO|nr:glycosyltransferase family 8 protein [Companilactobacillus halodurans]MQS76291.1 glycosyltransferase family 8 protein [Companilactobacillus halodurans]MQS96579.1 glycosyltransferase family 8 protein [Companilactobacillus halodurans]